MAGENDFLLNLKVNLSELEAATTKVREVMGKAFDPGVIDKLDVATKKSIRETSEAYVALGKTIEVALGGALEESETQMTEFTASVTKLSQQQIAVADSIGRTWTRIETARAAQIERQTEAMYKQKEAAESITRARTEGKRYFSQSPDDDVRGYGLSASEKKSRLFKTPEENDFEKQIEAQNKVIAQQTKNLTSLEQQRQKSLRSFASENTKSSAYQQAGQLGFLPQLQEYETHLKAIGAELNYMPTPMQAFASSFAKHASTLAQYYIAWVGIEAVISQVAKLEKESSEFQVQGVLFQNYNKVTGVSGVDNSKLLSDAIPLATKYGEEINNVVQDISLWTKQTKNYEAALALTNETLKFHLATGATLEETYRTLTGLTEQMGNIPLNRGDKNGLSLADTPQILQKITAAAVVAGAGLHQVSESGSELGGNFNNSASILLASLDKDAAALGHLGQSATEIIALNAALIQAFGNTGGAASDAAEKLGRIAGGIATLSKGGKVINDLAKEGINLKDTFNTTGDVFSKLNEEFKRLEAAGNTKALAELSVQLGGTRQWEALAAVIEAASKKTELMGQMSKNSGAEMKLAADMTNTYKVQVSQMNAEWDAFLIVIGQGVLPMLQQFVSYVGHTVIPAIADLALILSGVSGMIGNVALGAQGSLEFTQGLKTLDRKKAGEGLLKVQKAVSEEGVNRDKVFLDEKDFHKKYPNDPMGSLATIGKNFGDEEKFQKALEAIRRAQEAIKGGNIVGDPSATGIPKDFTNFGVATKAFESQEDSKLSAAKDQVKADGELITVNKELIRIHGLQSQAVSDTGAAYAKQTDDLGNVAGSIIRYRSELQTTLSIAQAHLSVTSKGSAEYNGWSAEVDRLVGKIKSLNSELSQTTNNMLGNQAAIRNLMAESENDEFKNEISGFEDSFNSGRNSVSNAVGPHQKLAAAQNLKSMMSSMIGPGIEQIMSEINSKPVTEISKDDIQFLRELVNLRMKYNEEIAKGVALASKEVVASDARDAKEIANGQVKLQELSLQTSRAKPEEVAYTKTLLELTKQANDLEDEKKKKLENISSMTGDAAVQAQANYDAWLNVNTAVLSSEKAVADYELAVARVTSSAGYQGLKDALSGASNGLVSSAVDGVFGKTRADTQANYISQEVQGIEYLKNAEGVYYSAVKFHTAQQQADNVLIKLQYDQQIQQLKAMESQMKQVGGLQNFTKQFGENFVKGILSNFTSSLENSALGVLLPKGPQGGASGAATTMSTASTTFSNAVNVFASTVGRTYNQTGPVVTTADRDSQTGTTMKGAGDDMSQGGKSISAGVQNLKSILSTVGIGAASNASSSGQALGSIATVFGALGSIPGPVGVGFSAAAAAAGIASMFGPRLNPTQNPDLFPSTGFGQLVANAQGSAGANGVSYSENPQLMQDLNNQTELQYLDSWVKSHPGGQGLTPPEQSLWNQINTLTGGGAASNVQNLHQGNMDITDPGGKVIKSGNWQDLLTQVDQSTQELLQFNQALNNATNSSTLLVMNQFGGSSGFFPYGWDIPGFNWTAMFPQQGAGAGSATSSTNVNLNVGGAGLNTGATGGAGATSSGSSGSIAGTRSVQSIGSDVQNSAAFNPATVSNSSAPIILNATIQSNIDGRQVARTVQSYTLRNNAMGYQLLS